MKNFEIEWDRLHRKLDRAVEVAGLSMTKVLDAAAMIFTDNVFKATPPGEVRTVERKGWTAEGGRLKRGVFPLRGKNLKNGQHADVWAHYRAKSRERYRVPFRTWRKHGVKYFPTAYQAEQFAVIKYRNVGKLGWYYAAPRPGSLRVPRVGLPEANAKAKTLSKVTFGKDAIRPTITMENRVGSLARFVKARSAMAWAVGRASNAVNGMANKVLKQPLMESWR